MLRRLSGLAMGLVVVLGSAACMQASPDDDGLPGESLGAYTVHAELLESTCGPGAFGSPDAWDFSVKLARDGDVLYWNNGAEMVQGKLAADGLAFSFSTKMVLPLEERKGAMPGCTIVREDAASGTLAGESAEDITGFNGELSYGYSQQEASDCTELVALAGADGLPCTIRYAVAATRTE